MASRRAHDRQIMAAKAASMADKAGATVLVDPNGQYHILCVKEGKSKLGRFYDANVPIEKRREAYKFDQENDNFHEILTRSHFCSREEWVVRMGGGRVGDKG